MVFQTVFNATISGGSMSKVFKVPPRKHIMYYVYHHDVLFEDAVVKGMDKLLALLHDLITWDFNYHGGKEK